MGGAAVLRSSRSAEMASLFDSVYVSFYKGLGAPAGSMLLGESDVIDEARLWRKRHGGTLFGLWPYAAAGLAGLRSRLPRMGQYRRACASDRDGRRHGSQGVDVVPDPPQTNMMHLHLRTTEAAVTSAHPPPRSRAQAVGLRGLGTPRHARTAPSGAHRRRRDTCIHSRRRGGCRPPVPARRLTRRQKGSRPGRPDLAKTVDTIRRARCTPQRSDGSDRWAN